MSEDSLYNAVHKLAQQTQSTSDADLSQPMAWRAHNEGARFTLLGTYHELRDLAVTLGKMRGKEGLVVTAVQRVLAQHHAAFRDLQAVLLGVTDEHYNQEPAPGEWPLRYVLGHITGAERIFFTLVHYGLARQRTDQERPVRLPDGEVNKVVGPRSEFLELMEKKGMAEMLAHLDELHRRMLDEFVSMSDDELNGPSVWWENEEYPLQYRLHRFDAHMRQHTVQAEKTLAGIGLQPNEARRLLRLIYNALAEVESATFGAADLGAQEKKTLAEVISARADAFAQLMAQTKQMVTAVQSGDLGQVNSLISANPDLVNTVDQNQLSMVMTAAYRRQQDIINTLVEKGAKLFIFEAAAIGRLDIVKRDVEEWPEVINEYGRDGFTPLQLACFFNHQDIALWLIDQGADVNAVAKNSLRIMPIHAAATTGNLTTLKALLEHGADVNARQQNNFTPLHTAADNGEVAMAQLFLNHNADVNAVTEDGQSPRDSALKKGHHNVAALLQ